MQDGGSGRDKRALPRIDVASVVLPFMGSRQGDDQPFQYILRDISRDGVGIAIPSWVALRERLNVGDRIELHVPFEFRGSVLDAGPVLWERWDDDLDAQLAGARLDQVRPLHHAAYLALDDHGADIRLTAPSGPGGLLGRVLKDSVLLKRGILIYFKHLEAFFSRITDFGEGGYEYFRDSVISDVRERVRTNAGRLEALRADVAGDGDAAVARLDLEDLRQAMEPEIYIDLFRSALRATAAVQYMEAIRKLEQKLLSHYNTVTMLYLGTLA